MNTKLDDMIDLLGRVSALYNDESIGFIDVNASWTSKNEYIQLDASYFNDCFGDAGTVYSEDEEYIRKEAYYNGVRFIALFDKKKEVKNNDCAA